MSFTVKWQLVYLICSLQLSYWLNTRKREIKRRKKNRRIFVEIGLISITAKWTYWIGSIQKVLLFPRKKIKSEYCLLRFPKDPTVFGNYITVIESTFNFIWTKFSVGIFFFQWFLLSLLTVRNNKVLIKVNSFKCLYLSVNRYETDLFVSQHWFELWHRHIKGLSILDRMWFIFKC